LTVPAHQWLIRDPEPLLSGLSGGRISVALVDQLPAMITTLRAMDDAAGGGTVLVLVQQAFGCVAGLLDQASYDECTGRRLHIALTSPPCMRHTVLITVRWAPTSSVAWLIKRPAMAGPPRL
jgi:hypothetical protein